MIAPTKKGILFGIIRSLPAPYASTILRVELCAHSVPQVIFYTHTNIYVCIFFKSLFIPKEIFLKSRKRNKRYLNINIDRHDMKAIGYIEKVRYLYSFFTFSHLRVSLFLSRTHVLRKVDNYGRPNFQKSRFTRERFLSAIEVSSLVSELRNDARSRWEAINGTRKVKWPPPLRASWGPPPIIGSPRAVGNIEVWDLERIPESARSTTGHVHASTRFILAFQRITDSTNEKR